MSKATGFLEESPGVRSMSRLAIAACLVLAGVIVGAIVVYTLKNPSPSAAVIGALVGGLTALVLNGVVALAKRSSGDTPEAKPVTTPTGDPS